MIEILSKYEAREPTSIRHIDNSRLNGGGSVEARTTPEWVQAIDDIPETQSKFRTAAHEFEAYEDGDNVKIRVSARYFRLIRRRNLGSVMNREINIGPAQPRDYQQDNFNSSAIIALFLAAG